MNDSQLYLLSNVEIDADNEFTIDFDSATAQQAYFQSKISDVLDTTGDFSYIRKDADVKVEKSLEDLLSVNYLMFKNDSKWWYARITNKEYISPSTTRIYFEIDAFQTFMFDFEIQESFIDREHQDRFTSNMKPIFNTKEENISYGSNYRIKSTTDVVQKMSKNLPVKIKYFLIISSDKLGTDTEDVPHINGYDPFYYYLVPISVEAGEGATFIFRYISGGEFVETQLTSALTMFQNLSKIKPSIISIKLIDYSPRNFAVSYEDPSPTLPTKVTFTGNGRISTIKASETGGIDYNLINISQEDLLIDLDDDSRREINTINLNFDFEVDKNNLKDIKNETKLLVTPYHFYKLTNNNGNELDINIAGLENYNQIPIYFIPNLTPQSKELYYIKNYYNDKNGQFYNLVDNSVNEMPLASDKWVEYLSQNKASATAGVAVNLGASALTTAIGAMTANPLAIAGGVLSLGQSIANTLIKQEDIKKSPDSARKLGNNATFNLARQLPSLQFEEIEIGESYKKSIFNYFYHYGYKVNDFKKPDYRSRYYFNYLKTIGVNIKSNIDSIYVNELKSMFNNGVTIWHYRDSNTWKGTNNFDYENAEMNLISTEVENG